MSAQVTNTRQARDVGMYIIAKMKIRNLPFFGLNQESGIRRFIVRILNFYPNWRIFFSKKNMEVKCTYLFAICHSRYILIKFLSVFKVLIKRKKKRICSFRDPESTPLRICKIRIQIRDIKDLRSRICRFFLGGLVHFIIFIEFLKTLR